MRAHRPSAANLLGLFASLTFVLACGATPATAHGPGHKSGRGPTVKAMPGHPGGGHHGMMGKKLGFDATQRAAVHKLHKAHNAKTAPLKLAKALKKAEMKVLWLQPKPSRKALLAKHKEILALKGKLMESKLDFKLSVLALLKPEQKLRYLKFMSHHGGAKMGRGHQGKAQGAHGKMGHGRKGMGGMH